VTVQISNMTALANVPDAMTAQAAYNKITQNTNNSGLPFQIDVGSGNMVTPLAVEVKVPSTSTPTPSPTTVPPVVTSTVFVTVTPSACPSASPCPEPTSAPTAEVKTYSRRYVVGLGFGMVIFGVTLALLAIFIGMFVYLRCNKRLSMRTGYERQVNIES